MAAVVLKGLTKRFGPDVAAVRDLTLEVRHGEVVSLLGPSGCGKTTTLRLVAGFLEPDAGEIWVGERRLSAPGYAVPPERRGMSMIFQSYAVWPHRTVAENVAYGLKFRDLHRAEAARRVREALSLVRLEALADRYPGELSGGQQQRVALARSLVVEPEILLLDEPLSNLDAKLRERMRWELKELQRRTRITFVYVTHDQAEALALSDRIAVMHEGALAQYGPPREVYSRPANRTVADFMGLVNLVPGRVLRAAGEASLVAVAGDCRLRLALPDGTRDGQAVEVVVRPEALQLSAALPADPAEAAPAKVAEVTFLGNLTDVHVSLDDGTRLRVQAPPLESFEVGQRVHVRFDSARCSVFHS